jgi:hypothetical protein
MGVGLRLTLIMLAVAGAAGCGGATTTHETSSVRSAAPVTHPQSKADPKLVYQLSVHYTFTGGADRVARTFFGGRDEEWVNPTSGAFNVRRRISRDVSDGRQEVTSSMAFGWDGPDTRVMTARYGSPEFIASQANVFSLVYLRAYLGQPTSVDLGSQIHRTTIDGRPAFTVAGWPGKGVTVTFTILRTITPVAASSRGLFTVQTHGAQITQRELSPGAHPTTVPAYWFGKSIDGLSLHEEYEETNASTRTDTVFFQYKGSDALDRSIELEESVASHSDDSGALILPTQGSSSDIKLRDGSKATIESVEHPSTANSPVPLAHTIMWISAGSTRVILRTTSDKAGADLASRLALL